MIIRAIAASVVVSISCVAAEAKKYVLDNKAYRLPVGSKLEFHDNFSSPKFAVEYLMQGQRVNGQGSMLGSAKESQVALEGGVLEIMLTEEKVTSKMTIAGEDVDVDNDEDQDPLLGVKILGFRIQDKWVLKAADDVKLTKEQVEQLKENQKLLNLDDRYSKVPRMVGESWEATPGLMQSFLGLNEFTKGEMSIKFKEVVEKNGHQCAVLVVKFDVAGKHKGMKVVSKGVGKVVRSLKIFEDVEVTVKGDTVMTGDQEGVHMTMKMPMEGKTELKIIQLPKLK